MTQMRNNVLSIRSVASTATAAATTPASSAYPSAYPSEAEIESEAEDDKQPAKKGPTFPFLSLPSELRTRIYDMVFNAAPIIIDLDPSTFSLLHRNRLLALFSVSRQIHSETTHQFFSTHTFRIFPTYPGRYFKTKKPLLARLPKHYKASITNLELRLGPGWNNPPQGWVVNEALGLHECSNVSILKVFVEFDPSEPIFRGFCAYDGFYENFCQQLLKGVLKAIPSISTVQFDAWSSVKLNGDMMQGLGQVVSTFEKIVGWGPERGWDKESDDVWLNTILANGGETRLTKNVTIFA